MRFSDASGVAATPGGRNDRATREWVARRGGQALGARLPWPEGVAMDSHVPLGTSVKALP